jgi:hypothetical protein
MFPEDEGFPPFDGEVTELSVLVPGGQAVALEQAAHQRGLTAAQMLRRLIQDFLEGGQCGRPELQTRFVRRWA